MISEPGHAAPAGFVPRLLVGLVRAVCQRPGLVLLLAAVFGAASVYACNHHLQYQTQRTDLISPHKDYQQRWRQYLAEFGDDDDMIVVVEGSSPTQMKRALDAVAARIQEHPQHFDRLFYKVDLGGLRNRALLFLPTASIQPIQHHLKSMGMLLDLGPWSWKALGLTGLLREARQRAGRLTPDQPLPSGDEEVLRQLVGISRMAATTLEDPAAYKNPWNRLINAAPEQQQMLAEPQYFFSGDGTLAFLMVRPVKEEGSFTAAKDSVEQLRTIMAEVRPDFAGLEFGLTGMPVLETDEMVAAERDARHASWLAIAGISVLFLLVYRGIWYPVLTVVTLLVGTAWAMGWLTLTVGHMNIVTASLAVMLIGMGDYGVLWAMRYEAARRGGMDVQAALLHTTTHVAVGNLTAASTLALAFFAAMLADFRAVAELGWIAGCGVLLCALACFTVLPALLMLCDRRGGIRRAPSARRLLAGDHWAPWATRRPGLVIGAGLLLTLGLGTVALFTRYDHNLLHLQAHGLDSVEWEMKLIEHTAGASWHALSYTATAEEALALKARYEQLPEVSQVVEVASLVPPDQADKLPLLKEISRRLKHLPARGKTIAHARPAAADVQTELTTLLTALEPLATKPDAPPVVAELCAGLRSLQGQLQRMPETAVAEERLQRFDERLAGDLAEDLHKLREVSTPAGIALADLPADLRERSIGQTGQWLLRVFAKECLWDFEPLEHFTRQVQKVDPEATGKPFTTVEGLKSLKSGFQWAGLYAFIAILAVLVVDFRSLQVTLLALLPLAMGLAMTLGVMVLAGAPLNPANMMAFPLILGVGIDNGVHILHDWLIRRREGLPGVSHAIGRGVLVKALTSMIGFGMLMISSHRGQVSLGFILTTGVGCCMLAALVVLPAVLSLLSTQAEPLQREQPLVRELQRVA